MKDPKFKIGEMVMIPNWDDYVEIVSIKVIKNVYIYSFKDKEISVAEYSVYPIPKAKPITRK